MAERRLFAETGAVYICGAGRFLTGADVFLLLLADFGAVFLLLPDFAAVFLPFPDVLEAVLRLLLPDLLFTFPVVLFLSADATG